MPKLEREDKTPKRDRPRVPPDRQDSKRAADKARARAGGERARQEATDRPRARAGAERFMQQDAAERARKREARTYVVQAGDSLSKIAKELLGDAARWPEIFELNKDQIKDPNLIQVGQELRIP
jgi:nucleoid-associated protein YgaU